MSNKASVISADNLNSQVKLINQKIISGVHYKQVLDYVFDSLQSSIPCDRISIALLADNVLTLHWLRSNFPVNYMNVGYSAPITGSSLEKIIDSGIPRVIADLKKYSEDHPQSESTRLAILEGIMSSLTCPLLSRGVPVGVVFFSSSKPNTYSEEHVDRIKELANSLALVVEQGRLQKFFDENQYKSKMYSMVTHDLRSPIGVMLGFLEIIEEEDWYVQLASKDKEVFSILRRNCESMLGLVCDLSDMTSLNNQKLSYDFGEVNSEPFFLEAIRHAEILAGRKNIVFKHTLSKNIPNTLYLDTLRIRQVLDNLISNAVKFSLPNTAIELQVDYKNEMLEICVEDQGLGIPHDEVSKLFKEYGKTSVRPTAHESSSGLGLAIVKKIVEAHGGHVSVETEPGLGSTFKVMIKTIR